MQRKVLLGLILIGLLIALFGWLDVMGLRAEEPRRALVSIEMMMNGDYILPHMFGWAYYNKPPLFNWVMILFFKLFGGTSEWVVRMPSMISLILLSFINYKVVKRYINKEVAILSSLFILTSAEILFYGSLVSGEIDLFFTLVIYLHIMAIFLCLQQKKYLLLFLLSYFLTGVGFLTKGLPSIAFQGLTLVTALFLYRKIRLIYNWRHFLGLSVFLVITGGYIYLLYLKGEHTGFLVRQFKEASQRTVLETSIVDTLWGVIKVPVNIIKLLLPWSLFFLVIFRKGLLEKVKENKLVLFSVFFILVNLPLYWFTGDFKPRYIYPLIPFFCIILGYFYLSNSSKFTKSIQVIEVIFGIAILLIPAVIFATFFIPELRTIKTNHLISLIVIVLGVALYYFYLRMPEIRIYLVVLLLILARIAMNNIYLPLYKNESRTTYYKNKVEAMLTLTKGESIYMTGEPHVYNSVIQLGEKQILTQEVKTAPILAFQIPYYITQQTGKVVVFEEEMKPGKYYLIDKYFYEDENASVVYEFLDKASNHTWYLIRLEE